MTKFINELSKEVFENTYEYQNEGIEGMWNRLAKTLDVPYSSLENFKFVPAGRICSNAGTHYEGTTMINCFVSGFQAPNADSMEGIMAELRRQALILKSEGGYGCSFSTLRPRGGYIGGIGASSPGAVKMMEMWDAQSRVITEGSGKKQKNGKKKIRKGAMMGVLEVWHPDIEEFIAAKQTPGRLSKFNISVGVTDAFMEAVKDDREWALIFPDYEADKEKYDTEWEGDIRKWNNSGGKIRIYKTLKARELYKRITESTYNRNEPGILFIDVINKMNNLTAIERIYATNPCGEEPLPNGGACLLGALNATQFINDDYTDWDYDALQKATENAVKFLDAVIEITHLPLQIQIEEIQNKRRIGLGLMGLASAFMMMRVRYGSKQSVELTEKWFSCVANTAYKTSALLAEGKGTFPLWDYNNFLQGGFHNILKTGTLHLIQKYGLRNSHLLTIAPTGNTGIMANGVSGGIEPIFLPEYNRSSNCDILPDGLIPDVPVTQKWVAENWEKTKEGDVIVYTKKHDGILYKYDIDRGFTKESWVRDYGVHNLVDRNLWDPQAKWAATTTDLSVSDHLKIMEIASRYIDSAISKTVNLPNSYSFKDFQNLYMNAWKTRTIKGMTTYRDGTMTAVLKSVNSNEKIEDLGDHFPPKKRPKQVDCDIHHITYKGEKYVVLVGVIEGHPYEIFVLSAEKGIMIGKDITKGVITKIKGEYQLDTEFVTVKKLIGHLTDEEATLTRLLSVGFLRMGRLEEAIKQLSKSPGSIASFAQVLKRVISRYFKTQETICPECGGKLVKEEGCEKCLGCGISKCA